MNKIRHVLDFEKTAKNFPDLNKTKVYLSLLQGESNPIFRYNGLDTTPVTVKIFRHHQRQG